MFSITICWNFKCIKIIYSLKNSKREALSLTLPKFALLSNSEEMLGNIKYYVESIKK